MKSVINFTKYQDAKKPKYKMPKMPKKCHSQHANKLLIINYL